MAKRARPRRPALKTGSQPGGPAAGEDRPGQPAAPPWQGAGLASGDPALRPAGTAYQDYQDRPWLGRLFRPLLISLVATSLVAGPLAILRAVTPWRLGYLLPLAWLATLEGIYTTHQLGRPQWRDRRGLLFRLGELALLLVVLRLAEGLVAGGPPAAAGLAGWLRRPGDLLDLQFWLTALPLLLAWGYAVRTTVDFMDLAIQPDEVAAYENRLSSFAGGERAFRSTSRDEVMRRFVVRWTWCGILIVCLAAVARLILQPPGQGLPRFGVNQAGLPPEILLALLCYFLAGFLLISEGRLAVLRGGWYNEDVQIAPSVLRRWQILGAAVLVLVGLIAGLLPLGSTAGLAPVLGFLLALVVRFTYLVLAILLLLFGLALYPFRFLFGSPERALPRPEEILRQIPNQREAARRLPDWLGGAVVWAILATVVIYLLLTYLGAHGVFGGRWAAGWARLQFWWRARWARLRARVRPARIRSGADVPPGRAPTPAARRERAPRLRPGALPPGARVRYFYLSALQRAAQRGLARPEHKTPAEFAEDLRRQWPDAEGDLTDLTAAFLEARYDDRPIAGEQAQGVQAAWQRVLRALRGRGKRAG